jgi:hypothetical protein
MSDPIGRIEATEFHKQVWCRAAFGGRKRQAEVPTGKGVQMFCPVRGDEVNESDDFCRSCGHMFSTEKSASAGVAPASRVIGGTNEKTKP